jgi:tetratricopeptide (TPR) repeat protein
VLALAQADALRGRIPEARERFRAALSLRPRHSETRLLAAGFFLDCGERDVAEAILAAPAVSIPSDPQDELLDDERYWLLRCRLAADAGRIDEALDALQTALRLARPDEATLGLQAALLRRSGRTGESARAAEEAARLAEIRKRLMPLSERFDRSRPDPAHCREIAELLPSLGLAEQADGWRRLADALAPVLQPNPFALPGPPSNRVESGVP